MERIYVCVRARPLTPEEAKSSPWRISPDSNSISISTPDRSANFHFDRVFGEHSSSNEVYEAKTSQLVAAAVAGFNGTVFAYGQTNSGKTHTMRGSVSQPGIIPLAVRHLFSIVQQTTHREFLLRMSYMEIYNEEINDLLVPEHRKLQIHESLERGIYVAGLREEIVTCPEQVLNFMDFGESHRHIGETNMNVYSSRSHTIFRMIIESRDKLEDVDANNVCDAVRVSVLNLVDLAGSERAAKTGAEGLRLKEGSHINKSLMTLGTVIKKLSEGAESQGGHVPYRDSKLTRILQPALGGNANSAIICNITLSQNHADETKSSLKFASRALRVTNYAQVNEILTDAALLKRQKKEIEELRAKLLGSNSLHFEEEILTLRNTLLQSEAEKERIALELQAEKEAQVQRDKRLKEQAKQIENLSCIILSTQKDGINYDTEWKMNDRRKTWCPTRLPKNHLDADAFNAHGTTKKFSEAPRTAALNIPFDELMKETIDDQESSEECCLPAAVHQNITNRRKAPPKKNCPILMTSELPALQAEQEHLLLKFEEELVEKDVEIECLRKELANLVHADLRLVSHSQNFTYGLPSTKTLTSRESEALVVIKQLEKQIKTLESDKSGIQETLESVVELAAEQKKYTNEKRIDKENIDNFLIRLASEVCEINCLLQQSGVAVDGLFSVVEELFSEFFVILDVFKVFKVEEYSRLKFSVAEMETNIISLKKMLHAADTDKEAALCTALTHSLDLKCMSNDLTSKKLDPNEAHDNTSIAVRHSMKSCMETCNDLFEKSLFCEENMEQEKVLSSLQKTLEVGRMKNTFNSSLQKTLEIDQIKNEKEMSINNKENARLRLMVRSTQAKLEAATIKYKEADKEMKLMDMKFQSASKELKDELEIVATENLSLRKLLGQR